MQTVLNFSHVWCSFNLGQFTVDYGLWTMDTFDMDNGQLTLSIEHQILDIEHQTLDIEH